MRSQSLCFAVLTALVGLAHAQPTPPHTPIDAAGRHAVIETLDARLQARYVFPDVARTLAAAIRKREADGAYAHANDADTFADLLGDDLRKLGRDGHFNVDVDPQFVERPAGASDVPSAEDVAAGRIDAGSRMFGIDSVARLPGNVGYMEVRGFGPTELVGEAMSAAMTLLSGSDALIIDLRRNGGGEPSTVAYLMSHFFAIGDERHLNDIYSRPDDSTRQYWTDATVVPRYTKPVYVLTSARTFSGGEEFAYDMQTQKRATLVGEVTGGGANPGEPYALGHDLVVFIPHGRSINPVTKTNWEHTGVSPDIATTAVDARKVAHAAALRGLIAASTDVDEANDLKDALRKVEAGVVDAPVYTARH